MQALVCIHVHMRHLHWWCYVKCSSPPPLVTPMEPTETGPEAPFGVAEWRPSDQRHIDRWVNRFLSRIHVGTPRADVQSPTASHYHRVIQDFKCFIENDPTAYMLFNEMFTQIPRRQRHTDPSGDAQIRDYRVMLEVLNMILTSPPEFNNSSLVGCPINAILDWPMGTQSGYMAFLNDKVNLHLKAILDEWGRFLTTEESCSTLTDDPRHGWFGEDARSLMPHFVEEFQCDPSLPYHGFKSWDAFFTRQFRVGQRPVAEPNEMAVIGHACESAPYRIALTVKRIDRFWMKAQQYSLHHMMGGDVHVEAFEGGTVYQAFLSALCYHRWHSPVSGTIVKVCEISYFLNPFVFYLFCVCQTRHISGTYFSETRPVKFDPSAPNESQGFLTEVATRCLVFIQADYAPIGLMCFMAVGMAEVSTCEITVSVGQRVQRGDQLGMFHFGGSTHCLLFRPEVDIQFELNGKAPGLNAPIFHVNSILARVGAEPRLIHKNSHGKLSRGDYCMDEKDGESQAKKKTKQGVSGIQ